MSEDKATIFERLRHAHSEMYAARDALLELQLEYKNEIPARLHERLDSTRQMLINCLGEIEIVDEELAAIKRQEYEKAQRSQPEEYSASADKNKEEQDE